MGLSEMQHNDTKEFAIRSTSETITADKTSEDGPTIYFDGSCALCSVEVDHYASRLGGEKLGFVDVSRNDARLGADLTSDIAMRRFHVRRPDGTLVSGAQAFVEVWKTLPGWRWAARLARIPGVLPVLEVGYLAFLPIRPFISKAVARLCARNTPTS